MLTSCERSLNAIFQVPVGSEMAADWLQCTGCVCGSSYLSLSNLQVWNSGRGHGGRESTRPGLFHRRWRQEADGASWHQSWVPSVVNMQKRLLLHQECAVTVHDVCWLQPDWVFVLGEQALDVCVPSFSHSSSFIFILGERNLYCLRDNGQIRFMKKMEFNPSCFLPYASGKTVRPFQHGHTCPSLGNS